MRPKNLGLLLCALLAVCPAAASAQEKLLTIEDIFDPVKRVNFSGTPASGLQWLADGEHYLHARRAGGATALMRVNARTGEAAPFFDAARMEAALAKIQGVTADEARGLARQSSYHLNRAQTAVLLNAANDLVYYQLGAETATRLTTGPEEETEEDFSPDGSLVSFVRGNDLYVVDVRTRAERRLTRTGNEKTLNGVLDWVYEEEIYGRGNRRGYWWSPDSRRLAYLNFDERPVKTFPVVDHIPRRQVLEDTPYPLAGDPNPLVRLGVVEAAGGETRWVDLAGYEPTDSLVVRVAWSPDSRRVVYQAQNREQTFLDLNAADPATGKSTRLFRETTKAWVEAFDDNPRWLKDGSFLWRSERTGWLHVYHYAADGRLIKQLTDGPWEVRGLDAVDEAGGWLYFHGTEHSHIAEHAYRVRLGGGGLKRLTEAEGNHRPNFSPTGAYFLDAWSDVNTPTQVRLYRADGTLEKVLSENKVDALAQYKLGKVEFMRVRTRDGFAMEAMMIKPPDFDSSKKYPVMSYTYSGPQAPSVRNGWGGSRYMWHQMLAQKGYIVWICDNRTASGKGAESAWKGYQNLGELELKDLEEGLDALRAMPFVDASRIGLWGWSYGGFMTSYALTHSKSFKMGIAGGTVSDWRLYDSIYTERVMKTPQNNPNGYDKSSVLKAAKNLSGRLLLIHGAMDDNVHMQNTTQLAFELQKAGKQFDLMIYPTQRHGVANPLQAKHMYQMMTDYILKNL
ncbi:MAG TPA: S9 family peptidase [Pyrinomonadaceae bacterium]